MKKIETVAHLVDHSFCEEVYEKLCQIYEKDKKISISRLEQHIKEWYGYDAKVGPTVQTKKGTKTYATFVRLTMTKHEHTIFTLKYGS